MLLRTLPEHYTSDSVFTWFALMTPEAMKDNLSKLGIAEQYSFDRPGVAPKPHVVESFTGIKAILEDIETFVAPYPARAKDIMGGKG